MFKFIAGYFYTQWETSIHRIRVLLNIVNLIDAINPPDKWKLYWRGLKHDLSKLCWYEAKYYAKVIFDLKGSTYGTEEYKEMLKDIQPAVQHHYKKNSHHPEYYENGFQDMTELDKLELICDWQAATKRHSTGNIYKSIEINQERFGYDNETKKWLISITKIIS